MRRWWCAAVPFAFSLLLSASTVGSSVGWQDSGFFLVGVREMALLHPPGFVLYLLVCKLWTFLFFFLDFTLAVHLFSSACAAAAAGVLALAARAALRTTDLAAALAGCLTAAGYTFWASAIYAKGYALYFLLVALLLHRLAIADESKRARDVTIAAALAGLAWAAHPAALLLAPALLLFAWKQRAILGGKGLAWRALLASGLALGPSLLIPLFASRESADFFGHPRSFGEFLRYVRGGRFTDRPGVFGSEFSRWTSAALFSWEEFLGVGLALVALGARGLDRRRALWLAAWVAPVVLVAVLFKIEGQLDFWLVPAWLPLQMLVAAGLDRVARLRPALAPTLAAAGLLWAVMVNAPSLIQRGNLIPDIFGRLHLQTTDPNAIVMLDSDDALATALYLQKVKGVRPDLKIVNSSQLAAEGDFDSAKSSYAARNAGSRPVFFEFAPRSSTLPAGWSTQPAGLLEKLVPRGQERFVPSYWGIPMPPEEVRAVYRRARGQRVTFTAAGIDVEPQPYEQRLFEALLRQREHLARGYLLVRNPEGFRQAAEELEAVLAADPSRDGLWTTVYPLAEAYMGQGRGDRAEPYLRKTLTLSPPLRIEARACQLLSEICGRTGRPAEALVFRERAQTYLRANPGLR